METFDPKVVVSIGDYILEYCFNAVCAIDESITIEIAGAQIKCNLTRDDSGLIKFRPFEVTEETMSINIINPHLVTNFCFSGKIFIGKLCNENDEERELCIEFILSPCSRLDDDAVMIFINVFTKNL